MALRTCSIGQARGRKTRSYGRFRMQRTPRHRYSQRGLARLGYGGSATPVDGRFQPVRCQGVYNSVVPGSMTATSIRRPGLPPTNSALSWMKLEAQLGLAGPSAFRPGPRSASSTRAAGCTRARVRVSGSMVVSLSWAGIISPRPLNRPISRLLALELGGQQLVAGGRRRGHRPTCRRG